MVGFVVFLLLLPARTEQVEVDLVDRPGRSERHCFTHLGWQDALGPLSCSRAAALSAGVLAFLAVRYGGRWLSAQKTRQNG